MICFVVTDQHHYTVSSLAEGRFAGPYELKIPSVTTIAYEALLTAPSIPRGTYIFTDIERLSDMELRVASHLYRALAQAPGCRVLNDPARVRFRYALLRSLKEAGLNGFDAYRADGHPRPARFPVFIRAEGAHDLALSSLLPDQAALDMALAELERGGRPLRGLIVIEFSAEPIAPGVFRRYGTFRVGYQVLLDHIVTEDNWNVKWGKVGLATEEMYLEDERAVLANLHSEVLARVFDLAGIDYGRADFGVLDGRPQIYEINTNPHLGGLDPHPSAVRERTFVTAHRRLAEAFCAIDTPSEGPPVILDSEELRGDRAGFAETPLGRAHALLARIGGGRVVDDAQTIRTLNQRLAAASRRENRLREDLAKLKAATSLFSRWKKLLEGKAKDSVKNGPQAPSA